MNPQPHPESKSIPTPSLLSHILVSKFCDSLPFYRQEKQFYRMGLALTRATMCNWAIKASGIKNIKSVKGKLKDLGKAGEALQTIRELYAIEKNAREMELTPESLYEERQKKAKPILDKYDLWLKEVAIITPPKSRLGKALNYTLGQWPHLIKYLDDGIIKMDNNQAENSIRPFVVGRKNWLFFEQPGGAEAGAILYSLIESLKLLDLNHISIFAIFLINCQEFMGMMNEQIKVLLPTNLAPDVLETHQKGYHERWEKT